MMNMMGLPANLKMDFHPICNECQHCEPEIHGFNTDEFERSSVHYISCKHKESCFQLFLRIVKGEEILNESRGTEE